MVNQADYLDLLLISYFRYYLIRSHVMADFVRLVIHYLSESIMNKESFVILCSFR